MKLSDEHFKRLQLQYEQYRKLRHDYYNHVSTIKGIKDEAERDAYIDDLTKQIESHRGVTFCSNAAVDALLFNEKAQADKVGVKIEFKIADLDSLTISSIDLCTILSNLIDNAIRGFISFFIMLLSPFTLSPFRLSFADAYRRLEHSVREAIDCRTAVPFGDLAHDCQPESVFAVLGVFFRR